MADYLILLEYQIKAWGFEIQAKRQSVYSVFTVQPRCAKNSTDHESRIMCIYNIWFYMIRIICPIYRFGLIWSP